MVQVSGLVALREADGSIGRSVSGATVVFEPQRRGRTRRVVTTTASGRYSVQLDSGNYLASVIDRNAGSSPTWLGMRVSSGGRRTVNFFLDSPLRRLRTLVNAFPGEMGVYGLNLGTQADVAANADNPMYLASVSKVAIAAACIDLMARKSELTEAMALDLYDHREERKMIDYTDLARTWTVRQVIAAMIRSSDTTATDVLCARYGSADIDRRIANFGISGFGHISSMIELDRRRYWMRNPEFGKIPPFAFSLYRRQSLTYWLRQLDIDEPNRGSVPWDEYRIDGIDEVSPRSMGALLTAIARKSLLDMAWKNDELLNNTIVSGGAGRFTGIVDNTMTIDGKGGTHSQVRNQVGLVRTSSGSPLATLVVFTERTEFPSQSHADASVKAAGELALRAVGIEPQLSEPTATVDKPLIFLAPTVGLAFKRGDRPVIRWDSSGLTGDLTIAIEDAAGNSTTISSIVADDGEWHSYRFANDLSNEIHRFTLTGVDTDGNEVTANSPWVTIGSTLHVLRPVASAAFALGSRPTIRWVSSGVGGRLTVRLLRNGSLVERFSTRATNDGEWHSWVVPTNLPRGRGYQIEVISNDDPNVSDLSAPFVVGGRIEVLSPSYEDVIDIGSKPIINWRSADTVGPLRIELLGLDGEPIDAIATNATDDGEWHSWTVPDVPDGIGYRIRVSERNNAEIFGLSALFQIGTRFEWVVPSAERIGTRSTALDVRPHFFPFDVAPSLQWCRVGAAVGQLTIELLKDGRLISRFSRNANDDGEWHSWTPDDTLQAGSDYSLRIRSTNRPTAAGRSVHFFVGGHVDVSISSRSFKNGSERTIKWFTEGLGAASYIFELCDRDDNFVERIARKQSASGDFGWDVDTEASGMHRVCCRTATDPTVVGFSEWFNLN